MRVLMRTDALGFKPLCATPFLRIHFVSREADRPLESAIEGRRIRLGRENVRISQKRTS